MDVAVVLRVCILSSPPLMMCIVMRVSFGCCSKKVLCSWLDMLVGVVVSIFCLSAESYLASKQEQ